MDMPYEKIFITYVNIHEYVYPIGCLIVKEEDTKTMTCSELIDIAQDLIEEGVECSYGSIKVTIQGAAYNKDACMTLEEMQNRTDVHPLSVTITEVADIAEDETMEI